MVDAIKGAGNILAESGAIKAGKGAGEKGDFEGMLKASLEKVNTLQGEADKSIEGLASGEVKDLHETMIAIEKADLSFNLMVQVRNKLIAAYEEVMRMQV
ncbi:MAG: flagellar hook-basal body complex protein FliE [Thermodesulfobacteriota bacterium]